MDLYRSGWYDGAMARFDPSHYGPVLAELIPADLQMPLDAGQPDAAASTPLSQLSIECAFQHTSLVDEEMARCCLSALWLLHNFLDESHRISQSIASSSGSYWHGIMHRREGDFSNSKYWMRRVGAHPVFAELAHATKGVAGFPLGDIAEWDAFAFVDACELALRRGNRTELAALCEIQQIEWELLFDFCYRSAVAE